MDVLKRQYELICGSRRVMLDFIENEVGQDMYKPLAEFNGSTVRYLLVHNANTYKHWLGNIAMQRQLPYADEADITGMETVRGLYNEADRLTAAFFEQFNDMPEQPITNDVRGRSLTITPLQLFTHVITHEFHHKGQMMGMCRLLGHAPPDTDTIRF